MRTFMQNHVLRSSQNPDNPAENDATEPERETGQEEEEEGSHDEDDAVASSS
ncbi:hypothetical protein FVEN_g12724 [Fusarium venenatum]|nr:hypothetical protein FVEN_g12724 [Fusarium venenatum]